MGHIFTQATEISMFLYSLQSKSARLWAFLLAVYWVSFVTYFVLWKSYKHVSNLRATARSSPDVKPEEFAVLVRDVPRSSPDESIKDSVDSYFRALHPNTFYRSMVVTDHTKVLLLLQYLKRNYTPLDPMLCFTSALKITKKDNFCYDHIALQADKIYLEIEEHKKKIARAEVIYANSKTESNPEGTKPTHRTGFLGLIGKKVDTIEYCSEQIKELLAKLEAEQKTTLRDKQQRAAIVFFNSRSAAASASQTLHAQVFDKWTVMEAPEPREMIWPNLSRNIYERQIRQVVVYFIVFLTVVFYMVPITFVSAFSNLDNLRKVLPFLKAIVDIPAIKTILQAYLPQIALIVFLALLPAFLMFLSKAEGIPSQSHVVRATSGKYFYFIVFNVFLVYTLGGSLIASAKAIANNPNISRIINMLATSLPGGATFFLTYVALK